jgi:hypothetical protein
MRSRKTRNYVALAVLSLLAQQPAAYSVTGSQNKGTILDHNSNRAVYGNKPIVTPRVNVPAEHESLNLGEREEPDAQHLTFLGREDEPKALVKQDGGRADKEADKDKGVATNTAQSTHEKQQFEQVLQENWTVWTGKPDGRLTLAMIALLLDKTDLPADQVSALSALAKSVENAIAKAYVNKKIVAGNLSIRQVDNRIELVNGVKGDAQRLDATLIAKDYETNPDSWDGAGSSLKIELMSFWDSWTASTHGVMTFALFDQLCKQTNPKLNGTEAAALAAMGSLLNNQQANKAIGAPIQSLKLGVNADGLVTLTDVATGKTIDIRLLSINYYVPGVKLLAQDTAKTGPGGKPDNDRLSLYGPTNTVNINAVRQADFGNCFFLSCVWATMQNYGTAYLENMIKQVGPDRFEVSFPGYAHNPIHVKLTPTEAAMFSYATNGGCYLSVLGMAAAHIATDRATGPHKTHDELQPFYSIVNGGYDQPYMHLFTGFNYVAIETDKTGTQLKDFEYAIKEALKDKIPVNICTSDHYMTVSQFYPENTPAKDLTNYVGPAGATGPFVTIHNQWGDTGPFPLAGTDYTVHMVNGYFTLPVASLRQYGLLSIQLPDHAERVIAEKNHANTPTTTPAVKSDFAVLPPEVNSAEMAHVESHRLASVKNGGCAPSSVSPLPGPGGSMVAGTKELNMSNGTILIAHAKPVVVNIPGGTVKIAPGAAVYISRHGNASAIFNLTNTTRGDVIVSDGDAARSVPVGQAVIVCTDTASDLKDINPCRTVIDPKHATLVQTSPNARTFAAMYSPIAVLDDSAQFLELVRSHNPADRALADRILKTAASMSQLTPSD